MNNFKSVSQQQFLAFGRTAFIGTVALLNVASCANGPRTPGKLEFPRASQAPQLGSSPNTPSVPSTGALTRQGDQPPGTAASSIPALVTQTETPASTTGPQWRIGGYEPFVKDTPSTQPEVQWRNGRLSFAFENAPIAAVVEAVLNGGLGASFTIDPEVKGDISLRTARALKREDVVAALDRALWLAGAALIENRDGTFTVTTTAKAPSLSPPARLAAARTRGGGLVIVPLQWTSAESMASLIEGFGQKNAVLRVDGDRQLLVLQGDERSLDVVLETIDMFDVDWLQSSDFAFYEIKWTDPDTLVEELKALLGGQSGVVGRQVEFVTLPRLRGVVVITKRPERQSTIGEWIERLDKPARGGTGRRIFHRWVINQEAAEVAKTLTELFAEDSQSGSGISSPTRKSNIATLGPSEDEGSSNAAPRSGSTSAANPRTGGNNSELASEQPPTSSRTQALNSSQTDQSQPTQERRDANPPSRSTTAQLTQGPRITADVATNALLVYSTEEEFRQIGEVLDRLDIAPDQVMIEATIAEVVLNDQLRYGVQWFLNTRDGGTVSFSAGSDTTTPSAFPGFSYRFVGTNVRAVLNALSQVTDVTVVSTPQIMTLDNKTATLQVGDQVPVITQSAQGTTTSDARVVNTVQYRDTGVLLTVTPRVGQGEMVQIDVSQEVSEVAGTTSSGIDSPTIQQRRFKSEVSVQNGQAVALGGLIRTRRSVGDTRVPGLGAIPVVGGLFRTRDNSARRTELIVFLTPRIVRSAQDATEVTNDLRTKMRRLRQSGLAN
jgi:general secretion pathway protein D